MITKINTRVLHSGIFKTNTSKLVWFCLLRDIDGDGVVKTSALSIANEIGVNEKTVRNVLSSFENDELIELPSPIQSPKKVRYKGRTIKLNGVEVCSDFKKTQIRKKSDIKSDTQQTVTKPSQDGFERFREWFNNAISGTEMPRLIKLTDKRKNALRSIFKEYDRETVEVVVQKVIASDFLAREWGRVNFDWIFNKSNFIKILEGNYDNRTKPIASTDNAATRAQSRDRLHALATQIVAGSETLFNLYNGVDEDPDSR